MNVDQVKLSENFIRIIIVIGKIYMASSVVPILILSLSYSLSDHEQIEVSVVSMYHYVPGRQNRQSL